MKMEAIRDLVEKSRQCNPYDLGRDQFMYIDISSVDREAKRIVSAQRLRTTEAPSRARKQLRAADVILSTVRPNLNAVAFVPKQFDGEIASTGFAVLRAQPTALDASYLFYFLQTEGLVSRLTRIATGASYPAISDDDVLDTGIPLPDLAEQKRIAAILERADRLRRLRRYAAEMADTVLPAAFRRMFGDPVSNPRRWKVVTVEEAGRVQLGRQRAPQYQTGKYRRPYIRVTNVYEDRIDLSDLLHMDFDENDFGSYKLEHGDILLNEGQSTELVGRAAMWRNEISDCCFQNTLIRFQSNRKICLPEFALWVFIRHLHAGEFAKMSAKTSNVAHLGAYRLAQMRIPIPPLPLQAQFADMVNKNQHLQAIERESQRQAEHLFQTLLHRAFTSGL